MNLILLLIPNLQSQRVGEVDLAKSPMRRAHSVIILHVILIKERLVLRKDKMRLMVTLSPKPKRWRGRPRKETPPPPKKGKRKMQSPPSPALSPVLQQFLDLVSISLHGKTPRYILQQLSPQSNSVTEICNLV